MYASNAAPETGSTVTGTLLDLIRRRQAATDRLRRENAYLRAEVARLSSENAALRARLDQGPGEAAS
jgi:cell division protein FtsB